MLGSNSKLNPNMTQFAGRGPTSFRQAAQLDALDDKKNKTMSVPIKMPGMGKLTSQQFLDPIEAQMKKLEASSQEQLNKFAMQKTAFEMFQKTLTQMKSANEKLMGQTAFDSNNIFSKRTVDIQAKDGNPQAYLSCKVSERAEQRTFTLSILRLAQRDKLEPVDPARYIEVQDPGQPAGVEGSLTIQGQQVTLTTNMSLKDIQYQFERAGSEGKFSVYLNTVSYPQPGTPGKYRFQVAHKDLATPLVVTQDPTTTPLQVLNLKASGKTIQDLSAVCFADGMEIQRTSNEIKDFIKGVTFTLKRSTPDAMIDQDFLDLTVIPDADAIQQGLRGFLETVGTFAEAYNLYCGRDIEGNPLTEDAVLAKAGFVFLTKVRDFLISPKGFFPAPGSNNLSLEMAGKMLEEQNLTFFGLSLLGMNLERNDNDSTLMLQFDESHFKSVIENHVDGIQRFFDFFFQSDTSKIQMLDFPEKVSTKLYKQDILIKAWIDSGSNAPQVMFALKVDQPDWVQGDFHPRSGEIKGKAGTLYEGLSLYTLDLQQTLGNDPATAAVHTISFSKGKSRDYVQAMEDFETHALKPELEKLARQEADLIKRNKQQITRLQKELEKTQRGVSKMVEASQKWNSIEQHLKQINGSKKDE